MQSEKCIICNNIIPEGLQLCPQCMKQNGTDKVEIEAAQHLRDIAAVLGITATTDKNIQDAMNGILNIAARLERIKQDGKEKKA